MKSINNYCEFNGSGSSIIEYFYLISNQNTNEKKRLSAINSCTKIISNSNNIFTTDEFLYW